MTVQTIVLLDHGDPAMAESIRRTLHAAYRVEASIMGVTDFPPLARSAGDVATAPSAFYGCWLDGELAGVVEVEPGPGDATTIASLAVTPERFGLGIGTRLVRHALGLGARRVRASTGRDNAPALALYRKVGFVAAGSDVTPEGIHVVHLEHPGAPSA